MLMSPSSSPQASISERLSVWAAGLDIHDLPDTVRIAVANTVLDTVALSIAAVDTDYGRAIRHAADTPGPCTVFGDGTPRSPYDAALINGTTGHGEDFDNTYEGCPVHSGVVVVPALFAAGEAYGLSQDRVALGMAAAIEVMCRLGAIAQKSVHSAGFHPTSVLGTVAAALGVGVARGHDAEQLKNTLGISASMSAGIIEYLADGSWTKRMHAGWAAQSGIRAAALGGAGFHGPRTAFEGVHGLYRAFAPSLDTDLTQLLDDLDHRWEAARIAFKPYACGTMLQPYVDCAVRLAHHGIDANDIEDILCLVGEGTVHRLWAPLELKRVPPTPYAAKFSGPYAVAAGFLHRDAGLAQFTEESIRAPDALALAAKVRFEIDPDNEYPRNYTGHLIVRLRNGQTVVEHQNQLRGGVRDPMSREQLLAKCSANLSFGKRSEVRASDLANYADAMFDSDAPFSATPLGA